MLPADLRQGARPLVTTSAPRASRCSYLSISSTRTQRTRASTTRRSAWTTSPETSPSAACCRRSPDAQGRYRICFGVQRWRAARLAGLATVPVVVRAQPCETYDQVAENLKRHGLSPLELARFIRGRVAAGESNAHIARKLAVDATTVAHHLSLLELPPVLNAALDSGRCTAPRTLYELQRLHAEQPDAVAALLASDGPVTRRAVAALRDSAAGSSSGPAPELAAPPNPIASLISHSQTLCDRLDRLLSRLVADAGTDRLICGELAALRQRLAALLQRLDG